MCSCQRLDSGNVPWRISTINQDYSLCETYPPILGVPAACSDEEIRAVAQFRSKGRLPVSLVWTTGDIPSPLSSLSPPPLSLSLPLPLLPLSPPLPLPSSLSPHPCPALQVLSWLHPVTHTSITRSSQPLVGAGKKRSKEDEAYILVCVAR